MTISVFIVSNSAPSEIDNTDQNSCGQGVINYYFSPPLTSLNFTGTNQQTGINGGIQIWNFLVSIVGACIVLAVDPSGSPLVGMLCSNIGIAITSAMLEKNGADAAAHVWRFSSCS